MKNSKKFAEIICKLCRNSSLWNEKLRINNLINADENISNMNIDDYTVLVQINNDNDISKRYHSVYEKDILKVYLFRYTIDDIDLMDIPPKDIVHICRDAKLSQCNSSHFYQKEQY